MSVRVIPQICVLVVCITLFLPFKVQGATAERIALVIGNASYPESPLRNPVNDARAMAEKLANLGFEVITLEDVDRETMSQSLEMFVSRLERNTTGLFYYAGHGIQSKGRNYLIPIDADLETQRALKFEAIELSGILKDMEDQENRLNLVILDACRNNPFEQRFRGSSQGLAAIDAARGTLIAYPTGPGEVAIDGEGHNGLYTEELLSALDVPDLKVEEVFKRVRTKVSHRTRGFQVPWESSSLTGDFVFNEQAAEIQSTEVPEAFKNIEQEALFWDSIKDSRNPEYFAAYLTKYPDGQFVPLAKIKLEEFEELDATEPIAAERDIAPASTVLLQECAAHLEATRLTTGRGGNAVDCYREVLVLDRGNEEALQGLERVADKYAVLIDNAIGRGNLEDAETYIARLEKINPEYPSLQTLRQRSTTANPSADPTPTVTVTRDEKKPAIEVVTIVESVQQPDRDVKESGDSGKPEQETAKSEVTSATVPTVGNSVSAGPPSELVVELSWTGGPIDGDSASGILSVEGGKFKGNLSGGLGSAHVRGETDGDHIEFKGSIGHTGWRLRRFKGAGRFTNGTFTKTVDTNSGGGRNTSDSGNPFHVTLTAKTAASQ